MKRFLIIPAILLATPAFAHAFLDEATPKVGSSIAASPKEVRIKYTQPVEPAFSHITMVAANGNAIATGTAAIDPNDPETLIVPVTGAMTPGHYEVRWDVVSVDTHRTNGHYPFDYQP